VKKTILLLALVACSKDEKPATTAPPTSAASAPAATAAATAAKVTELGPGKQRIDGQNFTLDVASTACKAGAECTLTIKLQAAADYHVNKEYPYKLTANAAPGLTFLGKKDPNIFAKETGDFVEEGEKSGTMTVRFKPAAAGAAKVAGTYKMSVCSADQCQIEVQPVALDVPVN
jgi:hypothetical protein